MTQAMKNSIFQSIAGFSVLAVAFLFSVSSVHAQVAPTTCPQATVFYANGYSMNSCLPSYPQGYPNITVYPGNGAFYGSGGYTAIQTNPFTSPMYSNNGTFAPGMTQTGPTYYYPPAPTYPNGYYYGGNGFYNTPGNTICFEGCGNGPSGNYHGGYYGGNAGNGYWYGGGYGPGHGGGYWPH